MHQKTLKGKHLNPFPSYAPKDHHATTPYAPDAPQYKTKAAFRFKRNCSFLSRYGVDGTVDLQGAAAAPAPPAGMRLSLAFSFLSRWPWHGSFCRCGSIFRRSILLLHRTRSSVARSGSHVPSRFLSPAPPNATEIPSTSIQNLKPFASFS